MKKVFGIFQNGDVIDMHLARKKGNNFRWTQVNAVELSQSCLSLESDVICKLSSSAFLYFRKQAYQSSWAKNRKKWQTTWENWSLRWSWRVRRRLKLKIYWGYRNLPSDQFGKKYLNTGEINIAKRSGRPSKMSQRDRNWLVRQTKMNRGRVLNDINNDFNRSRNENDHVHPRTVQIFLHAQDVKRRVVRKKMVVSQINRIKSCFVASRKKKNYC